MKAAPQGQPTHSSVETQNAYNNDRGWPSDIGTTAVLENTGRPIALVTDGHDQADEQLATLTAPLVIAFPSGQTGPTPRHLSPVRAS